MKRQNYRPHQSPETEREEDWRAQGNCAALDPSEIDVSLFPLAEQFTYDQARESRRICGPCPVKAQCEAYGRSERLWGTWGGVQSWEWGRGIGPDGEKGEHGTLKGYRAHVVAGHVPLKCSPCRAFWREYQADYKDRRTAEVAA